MTTTHCPACEDLPRGPLCRTHRQELARTIHELRLGLDELKRMERREIRHSTHGGGAVSPAFPQAPMDMTAADLYDYAEDSIQDVAGDIGLWGGKAPQVLNRLTDRFDRLADAPNSGRDYRNLTRANKKVQLQITPRGERTSLGHCLNRECGAELTWLPCDTMSTCGGCGCTWGLAAVRRALGEELKGRTITCTPKVAAEWTQRQTGRRVSRNLVSKWIERGKLPSAVKSADPGKWVFDAGELIACA